MNLYVLDWWRGQTQSDVWIEKQCDLIVAHHPECWFGEGGPIRRAIEPFLMKRISDRRAFCRLEWLPSLAKKTERARSIQALASTKSIVWPRHSPWRAEVEKQLLQFPAGKLDDAVDVFSLIGRGLEHIRPAAKPLVRPQIVQSGGWQA
jgi:predicted phage terminase large subunit-like protein